MIHKRQGKYDSRMKTSFGTMAIPPNDDKMINFIGSNAFGNFNSIYNPTGS
jgi:hypothetical protein